MAHYGNLGTQVSDEARDVRGTTVRGGNGEDLGKISDVIFDHDTMEIGYIVVDGGDWLAAGTFLLPADRVSADEEHEDGLATDVTKQQIENAPQSDRNTLDLGDGWKKYEEEFKKYWDEEPVMHIKGSDHIITPPDTSAGAANSASQAGGSSDREINAAELFPERMTPVFTDPEPKAGKVTLRPRSVARAEEAASGVTLLKPRWWEAFENYLQIHRDEIQAKCPECSSGSQQTSRVA